MSPSGAPDLRAILREAFGRAGLPYPNPHSFRETLAAFGRDDCKGFDSMQPSAHAPELAIPQFQAAGLTAESGAKLRHAPSLDPLEAKRQPWPRAHEASLILRSWQKLSSEQQRGLNRMFHRKGNTTPEGDC